MEIMKEIRKNESGNIYSKILKKIEIWRRKQEKRKRKKGNE